MRVKLVKGIIASLGLFLFPLSLKSDVEFPLIQAFTVFPFSEKETVEKNQFSLSLHTRYSNVYSLDFEKVGVNDFEMASIGLDFQYGLIDGLTLELYYRYFFIYGGFLDGAIEVFHEFFNLPSARRDHYTLDSVHYFYKDYFQYTDATGTSSPLIFSILKQLEESNNITLYGRLFIGIPLLAKPGFVSDQVSWGLGLMGKGVWKDFCVFSSIHTSFIKAPEWMDAESLKPLLLFFKIQLTYKRFLTGFILKTSPFKFGYFSSNAHQLYVGYKISDKIEIGIVEDLPPLDTTPDMGFYFKYNIL